MIHNYAVIHAADRDLMIPSETAASSLSSLPSPNDSMTADGMTGSDDDHDDGRGDVDAICQDFSRVLRVSISPLFAISNVHSFYHFFRRLKSQTQMLLNLT